MAPRRSARRAPPSTAPYPAPSSTASDDHSSGTPASALPLAVPRPPNSRTKRGSASRSPEQELSPLGSGAAGTRTSGRKGKRSPPAKAPGLDKVPEAAEDGKKADPATAGDVKMETEHTDSQAPGSDPPELEHDGPGNTSGNGTSMDDADGEEDQGETRCWCGSTDDDSFQIQCESCRMWQHGPCMGFTDQSEVEEDGFHHWCEICRPDLWSGADHLRRQTRSAKHKRTPSSAVHPGPTTSPVMSTHAHPDSPLLTREPKRRATMNSSAAAFDAAERGLLDPPAASGSVEEEGERRGGKKRRRGDDQDVTSASVPTPPPATTGRARPSRAAAANNTPSKRPRAAHNRAKDPPSPSSGYIGSNAGSIPDHVSHMSFVFTDPPGSGNSSVAGGSPPATTAPGSAVGLGLSTNARPQNTVPINAFSLPALVQHFPAVVPHVPTPAQTPLVASPESASPVGNSTTPLTTAATQPGASSAPTPAPAPVPAGEIASSLALKCKIKWPSKRITPGEMKKRVGTMLMWGMRVGNELERREERGRELGLWGVQGTPSPSPAVEQATLPETAEKGKGKEKEKEKEKEDVPAPATGEKEQPKEPNVIDLAVSETMPTLLPDALKAAESSTDPAPSTAAAHAATTTTTTAPAQTSSSANPTPPRVPNPTSATPSDLRLLTQAANLTSPAQAQDLLRQLTQRLVQVNELWNSRVEMPLAGGVGEGVVVSVGRR